MNLKKILINTSLALSLVLTSTPLAADAASFKDTKGHWAESAIDWAERNNIVNGYPDGTYKPNKTVTEEEFVSMLLNAFEYDVPKVEIKRWSDGMYAVANNYNYPVASNNTVKATPLKRYRVAELVAGTQGKNYSGDYAIQYVMGNGLASGKVVGEFSIASFKGNDTLTRAEAASFIMKLRENPKTSKVLLKRPATPSPISELPPMDKGVTTPPATGKLPTKKEDVLDPKLPGEIRLDVARAYEMAVHDSYKFTSKGMSLTLPKQPEGYYWDIALYVDYKDGTDGILGSGTSFVGNKTYNIPADWSKVKEAYFRVGLLDADNYGQRRFSLYEKSTGKIIEKVNY